MRIGIDSLDCATLTLCFARPGRGRPTGGRGDAEGVSGYLIRRVREKK